MAKRGIIFFVWGNYKKDLLKRAISSVTRFNYKYEIIRDASKYDGFRKRIDIFNKTPFYTTLLLDVDAEIRSDITFGFNMAEKYGLACSLAPSTVLIDSVLPQYNCGVLFFSAKAKETFDLWSKYMKIDPESAKNDQPSFARAVYHTINPYVLPKNWNYRPHLRFHGVLNGELKILHSKIDYENENICNNL